MSLNDKKVLNDQKFKWQEEQMTDKKVTEIFKILKHDKKVQKWSKDKNLHFD